MIPEKKTPHAHYRAHPTNQTRTRKNDMMKEHEEKLTSFTFLSMR